MFADKFECSQLRSSAFDKFRLMILREIKLNKELSCIRLKYGIIMYVNNLNLTAIQLPHQLRLQFQAYSLAIQMSAANELGQID